MDGITGPPTPYEVEADGRRMKVYDWLKRELGLKTLPGEEEGHEVSLPLYDAVVPDDLLKQWEQYLDKCIDVTREAQDCRFYLGGKWLSADQAAAVFASNRADALQRLKRPDIKHPDEKDLYNPRGVLIPLTRAPVPRPEDFADKAEYQRALHRHHTQGWRMYVEEDGVRKELIPWLLRKAGEPPPMPQLKKK